MEITHATATSDGGIMRFVDDKRDLLVLVYGLNEVRQVLDSLAPNNKYAPGILANFIEYGLPEKARRPTRMYSGTFVKTLLRMSTYYELIQAEGQQDGNLTRVSSASLIGAFFSDSPDVKDAIITYCDDRGDDHIRIIFSKEQGQMLVRSFGWLDDEKAVEIRSIIEGSGLPPETTQEIIEIDGDIALYFNGAYLLEKESIPKYLN
jgi:hypothetical protein